MRRQIRDAMEKLYKKEENSDENTRFADFIGVKLIRVRALKEEIFSDFDENNFGVSWWQKYSELDFRRRILIGDQLVHSLVAVEENMVEGQLHLNELLDYWDQEDLRMKDAIKIVAGKPQINFVERTRPLDHFINHMSNLHFKGFLGSISSAIDCASAAVVGVMGLRIAIISSGYPGLRRHFREKYGYANEMQRSLVNEMDSIENRAGPSGWLDWAIDYRNMSTHRGRRTRFSKVMRRDSPLVTPKGQPVMRADVVPVLVSNPAVSEIESMKDGTLEMLSEHGETTCTELFKSTFFYLEELSRYLKTQWELRRQNPDLIIQPPEQWKEIRNGAHKAFKGFDPGKVDLTLNQITMSEDMVKRLKAASLLGDDIKNWSK